ncbi:MAG: exodeoxyribonuclease VII small subunit [Anaerolineaceae bacterium]|nr:exodeoxyribonuclease VII small subunit [Anaerolineaceae bacterium]
MVKKPASIKTLNYEQALAELEKMISDLENNPNGLEKSVVLFERGKALIQHCQKLLDEAELKVQQLEEDGNAAPIKKQTT